MKVSWFDPKKTVIENYKSIGLVYKGSEAKLK